MFDLTLKELKKICRRPLCIICCAVCLLLCILIPYIEYSNTMGTALIEEAYGSVENVPKKVAKDSKYYGMPEGVVMLVGKNAIEKEKEYAKYFEGIVDNERFEQFMNEFLELENNPDNYTDILREDYMLYRQMMLEANGLSKEEAEQFTADNPVYIMKDEVFYSKEMRKWGRTWQDIFKYYAVDGDGNYLSLEETFPTIKQPAYYSYNAGMGNFANDLSSCIGMFVAIMLIAGLAPVFSDEVHNNTEPVLMASKYGKDKLISAKIAASYIYVFISIIGTSFIYFITMGLLFGFGGLNNPLQFYINTAKLNYSVTIGQYILLLLLIIFISAIALASIIILISALINSPFIVVFTSFGYAVLALVLSNAVSAEPLIKILQLIPGSCTITYALMYIGNEKAIIPFFNHLTLCMIVCVACTVLICFIVKQKYKKLNAK